MVPSFATMLELPEMHLVGGETATYLGRCKTFGTLYSDEQQLEQLPVV